MSGSRVRWAIRNTPAMNTIVVAVLVVGTLAAFMLRREVFPQFELELILVSVPYPGASPDEVESGICQKVEEAVRSVAGIKKVTSVAAKGVGNVVIEVRSDLCLTVSLGSRIEKAVAVDVRPESIHKLGFGHIYLAFLSAYRCVLCQQSGHCSEFGQHIPAVDGKSCNKRQSA